MYKVFTLTLIAMMTLSAPVHAQGQAVNADDVLEKGAGSVASSTTQPNEAVTQSPMQKTLEQAKKENEDKDVLKQKIALAKKMHEVRPTRSQVDAAVQRAAMMLPENERTPFSNVMSNMLNYNAIERISMDAMIETYTLKELEVMVDFYSKPEALSASLKMGLWAEKVQPEIIRMIDKAILRIRTGE